MVLNLRNIVGVRLVLTRGGFFYINIRIKPKENKNMQKGSLKTILIRQLMKHFGNTILSFFFPTSTLKIFIKKEEKKNQKKKHSFCKCDYSG